MGGSRARARVQMSRSIFRRDRSETGARGTSISRHSYLAMRYGAMTLPFSRTGANHASLTAHLSRSSSRESARTVGLTPQPKTSSIREARAVRSSHARICSASELSMLASRSAEGASPSVWRTRSSATRSALACPPARGGGRRRCSSCWRLHDARAGWFGARIGTSSTPGIWCGPGKGPFHPPRAEGTLETSRSIFSSPFAPVQTEKASIARSKCLWRARA